MQLVAGQIARQRRNKVLAGFKERLIGKPDGEVQSKQGVLLLSDSRCWHGKKVKLSAKRTERALRARDLGLMLVRAKGVLQGRGSGMQTLDSSAGSLQLTLRTPFGWTYKSIVTDADKYRLAALHARHKENLPYGLDLWTTGRKVLNIEWDDKGNVEILGYCPGPWEDEVAHLAHDSAIRPDAQHSSIAQAVRRGSLASAL